MESPEKQDIITGNGTSKIPILANENEPMADPLNKPQPAGGIVPSNTAKETNGTKPQTLTETVSLLQSDCFDLRSFGCKVVILTRDGRMYIAIDHPDHSFGFDIGKGNILIDDIAAVKK
jgi:hypothetical protein